MTKEGEIGKSKHKESVLLGVFVRIALILAFALTGCFPNSNQSLSTWAMSDENVFNLSRISLGMSREEVLHVMHKPYRQESFIRNNDLYEVWFYVTKPTGLDQSRLLFQNLTPLTFKNGTLAGWGYVYYRAMIEEQPKPETPKKDETESKEIEHVLQKPSRKEERLSLEKDPDVIVPFQEKKETPKPKNTSKTSPKNIETYPVVPQKSPPKQPQATQPKPPKQPQATNPKPIEGRNPLSLADPPSSEQQEETSSEKDPASSAAPLDPQGQKMLEEEEEENFDFW